MNDLPSRSARQKATLLGVSLRHYRAEIRLRMMRYKQLVVASVLLLLPSMVALKNLVFAPLVDTFVSRGTPSAGLAAGLFVAATALWAALQRDAVAYPPAAAFIASLPFARQVVIKRDLTVFALASSPFLVLIFLAFLVAQPKTSLGPDVLVLLGILLASFVSQLAVARKVFGWALAAVVMAALIGGAPWAPVSALAVATCALMLRHLPPHAPWRTSDYRQTRGRAKKEVTRAVGWFGLHLRSLYQATHSAYRFSILASVALTVAVATAQHAVPDASMRNSGLLLVHGALVTGWFGMSFATLFKNQTAYGSILDSLPTGQWRRIFSMIVAVEFPALLLVLLLAVGSLNQPSGLATASVSFGAAVVLSGLQFLIYRYFSKHTIALGLVAGIVIILTGLQLASSIGAA